MQIKYLSTAWNDIRQSPGWLAKALLLGLVACIPIFGWIVVYGYLYGWARDMAWGVHAPLPARIFGNEDGKLYSRGFFDYMDFKLIRSDQHQVFGTFDGTVVLDDGTRFPIEGLRGSAEVIHNVY